MRTEKLMMAALCGVASAFAGIEIAPIDTSADRVKTPTLFIHSMEDYRCPIDQGYQMFTALVAHGVETKMVCFKGENHELSRSGRPSHRLKRLSEITEWFEKHRTDRG